MRSLGTNDHKGFTVYNKGYIANMECMDLINPKDPEHNKGYIASMECLYLMNP